ncbi:MAG: helix-turn-helix domain-containing protein [Pseudonocardiaceae bacterium]
MTTIGTIGRARCPLCGARLRQGRQLGELCNPCERVGLDPGRVLPADFYHREPVAVALASYDIGAFFVEVRRASGWTQQTLAGVLGLTQSHVSAVERG